MGVGPCELRLTVRPKYGHAAGCIGCANKEAGLPDLRQHAAGCRRRTYECMKNDTEELDRMVWHKETLGRGLPRSEQIRTQSAPMYENAGVENAVHGGGWCWDS